MVESRSERAREPRAYVCAFRTSVRVTICYGLNYYVFRYSTFGFILPLVEDKIVLEP